MSDSSWQDAYAKISFDKLRYADTDRQGHVNNAAFSTFLETGRVELLYDPEYPLAKEGAEFVIAQMKLDFQGEISWPGRVEIGTRVGRIGKSSIVLEQGLFQDDRKVGEAESVIVQIDRQTRKSSPLAPETLELLERLRSPGRADSTA